MCIAVYFVVPALDRCGQPSRTKPTVASLVTRAYRTVRGLGVLYLPFG